MTKITITVSGQVGSGKSTLASAIAHHLGQILGPDKVTFQDDERTPMDQLGVYATLPTIVKHMRDYIGPVEILTKVEPRERND